MQKYTGTRAQFEKLAPKGLILHSSYYHAYLYYRNGKFRFLSDECAPSLTKGNPGEELLQGAWCAFSGNALYIYKHPTIHLYKRPTC